MRIGRVNSGDHLVSCHDVLMWWGWTCVALIYSTAGRLANPGFPQNEDFVDLEHFSSQIAPEPRNEDLLPNQEHEKQQAAQALAASGSERYRSVNKVILVGNLG